MATFPWILLNKYLGNDGIDIHKSCKFASSSFRPLDRAQAIKMLHANSLDVTSLWNPRIEHNECTTFPHGCKGINGLCSNMATKVFFKFELCLKYLVPHHFVPLPFWISSCSTLKACAFNKRYMSLFEMMFSTKVWTSMKSNHLSDMGVTKPMRCSISLKKMSISILLKLLKKTM